MTTITDTDAPSTGRLPKTRAYRPWTPTPDNVRPMLIDVVASALLGVMAVNAFDPAFGGMLWLTVGVLGVFTGLLVAYGTIQFRLSPITAVLATLVGFVLFGARAVPDTAVAGVLPGPSTPGALFDGITHGWARLLTTVPPVGSVDHLSAIVYLGGFVAGGGALNLARHTKSAWMPVIPGIIVAVAAILVGTASPATLLAQGAGIAIVIIGWSSLRAARTRPRVHVVGSNVWTRRLTASAFAVIVLGVGLVVSNVQPIAGPSKRYVLRQHTEPPFDPNNYPSPLAGYPKWRAAVQPDSEVKNQVVMSATNLPKDVPIRVAVMDLYNGTVWLVGGPSNSQDQSGSGKFQRVGSDLDASGQREPGQSIRTTGPTLNLSIAVDLDHYSDVWVPDVSGTSRMAFAGTNADSNTKALRFNKVSDSAAIPTGIGSGSDIALSARVPVVSYIGPSPTRDKIVGNAPVDPQVSLPDITDATSQAKLVSLKSEGDKLTQGATTDYAKAKALETALTKKGQGVFDDGLTLKESNPISVFRSGHDLYQMSQFLGLLNPKDPTKPLFIGNAERYAAAMAGMARAEGLPARVVVGFRSNADDKTPASVKGKKTEFTADQADAWVEIAFQGVGWVAFYPTPPRSQTDIPAQPPQTQSTKTADVQAQPPVSPPPNPALLQNQTKHQNDKNTKSSSPFHIPAWVWLVLKIIFYPLILIAAVVGSITGYKRWRRNRRKTRGTPVDRVSGAWAEMLDQLRDLGTPVPRKGTRLEIAGGIPPEQWDQMTGFAAGIDAAMFGPDDPSDQSVSSLWDWVEDERAKLLEGLERKRRWIAQLNLRSLKPWR